MNAARRRIWQLVSVDKEKHLLLIKGELCRAPNGELVFVRQAKTVVHNIPGPGTEGRTRQEEEIKNAATIPRQRENDAADMLECGSDDMIEVAVLNIEGQEVGKFSVDEALLGTTVRPALLKQAVVCGTTPISVWSRNCRHA